MHRLFVSRVGATSFIHLEPRLPAANKKAQVVILALWSVRFRDAEWENCCVHVRV
jgi:hypothetical protein